MSVDHDHEHTHERPGRNPAGFLHGDGALRIETWLTRDGLAPPLVPMYGTVARARPLVSNGFLGVDLVHVPAGKGFDPHTHPGDHLLIVVGGTGTITYDGAIYRTHEGQVYLVEGSVPHAVGAITDTAILAVGAPHRPADSADRMQFTAYDAVAATLGEMHCLVCDDIGTSEALRGRGCAHAPEAKERDVPWAWLDVDVPSACPVRRTRTTPAPPAVLLVSGARTIAAARDGVLVIVVGDDALGRAAVDLASSMAACGPPDGTWQERDAALFIDAAGRLATS